MEKKHKEDDINTLGDEVALIQIKNFINDFDSAMEKDIKGRLIKYAIIVGPILLSLLGYLVFHNPVLITIGLGATGASSAITIIVDQVKEFNKTIKYNPNISKSENNEKSVDQILKEGIGKKTDEEFYTEEYKSIVEAEKNKDEDEIEINETEEQRKYREALEKQQKKVYEYNPNLRLVDDEDDFLDKDETMTQIVSELNVYCEAYNLPPLTITNAEWDILFDTSYKVFHKKGIENRFYDAMSELGRLTFAKALVNKQKEIGINEFVDNLYNLQGHNIDEKEVIAIEQVIRSKLSTARVIDLEDYKENKRRSGLR